MLPLALALSLIAPPEPTVDVRNLGHATGDMRIGDEHVAYLVAEGSDGGVDYNGDGDAADGILFLRELTTGVTRNLQLAPHSYTPIQFIGGYLFLGATEFTNGVDYNGDGDMLDRVLHRVDLETVEVTNLGLATSQVASDSEHGAFLVSELAQGQDLDGDGLLVSNILHLMTIGGPPVSTGVDTNGLVLSEGLLGTRLKETVNGDLNGDGDQLDQVLALYDFDSGTVIQTGLALSPTHTTASGDFRVTPDWVAFYVDEASQGETDLDGNGTADGRPAFAVSRRTGALFALGEAGTFVSLGDHLAHLRGEGYWDSDLNEDGDKQDAVVHAISHTGEVVNLKLAGAPQQVSDAACVIASNEFYHGDVNGDGDEDDYLLHVLRSSPLELIEIQNEDNKWTANEVALVYPRTEQDVDWNGDGDTHDVVPFRFEFETGTQAPIPLAIDAHFFSRVAFSNGVWGIAASELAHGSADLNGDLDNADFVVQIWSPQTGEIVNTGGAQFPNAAVLGFEHSNGHAFFRVNENAQGYAYLNADSDWTDDVLHEARF